MSASLKKNLIALFTFIGGVYFVLYFFLPKEIGGFEFGMYHEQILRGLQIMAAAAIGLGLINIFVVHGSKILHRKKSWGYSLVLFFGFVVTLGIEMGDLVRSESVLGDRERLELLADELEKNPSRSLNEVVSFAEREIAQQQAPFQVALSQVRGEVLSPAESQAVKEREAEYQAVVETLRGGGAGERKVVSEALRRFAAAQFDGVTALNAHSPLKLLSKLIFESFYVALGSAMFSLLAFYIANAAYRSFRIRSFEAVVLMVSAVVIILGQIPHGPLYIWEGLPQVRLWVMQNVSTPARRAVFFGTEIAALALAVRIWLSLERPPVDVTGSKTQ